MHMYIYSDEEAVFKLRGGQDKTGYPHVLKLNSGLRHAKSDI